MAKTLKDAKEIRQAILETDDIQQEPVEAWGLTLTVRGLTGAQRDEWEGSIIRMSPDGRKVTPNMRNYRAKLIAMCIVDAQGKRVFNEADVDALGKKSGQELSKVYKVAQRLSGMSDEDVEELAKNFESGQPDDSGTG